MPLELLTLSTDADYNRHFCRTYCSAPIVTHDGFEVEFRPDDFAHCCYESSRRDGMKDKFSQRRAERLDWISEILQDPSIPMHLGWDNAKKRAATDRRVSLLAAQNYVVVVRMTNRREQQARFLTAFVIDNPKVARKIATNPAWK